jgi:DNA-binding CsgD family transcriptional regulator
MAHLPDADGRRCFLQIVPVGGRARDVFLGTAAVAVLIDPARQSHSATIDRTLIGESLSLTNREVDVARLVAEGLNPPEIARLLRIQVGTARDHLKSIFEKTGTRRQSELAALLGRLRP